jgi:hypothetical protein
MLLVTLSQVKCLFHAKINQMLLRPSNFQGSKSKCHCVCYIAGEPDRAMTAMLQESAQFILAYPEYSEVVCRNSFIDNFWNYHIRNYRKLLTETPGWMDGCNTVCHCHKPAAVIRLMNLILQ